MTAHEVLDRLLDPGTFRSWDSAPASTGPGDTTSGVADPGPEYAAALARARARSRQAVLGPVGPGGRAVPDSPAERIVPLPPLGYKQVAGNSVHDRTPPRHRIADLACQQAKRFA